ncbi:MAG: D-hexose-6-phosphate mutarotase [Victivallaceae bacterium]|nr:D-hexose-6-phosphate mutarotase [Victivallaceae bacterium]
MNIEALRKEFEAPGVKLVEENGIAVIEINNPLASARISTLGAHIMSWTPSGGRDVIWMSRRSLFAAGKAIRGGSPLCWPWFGSNGDKPKHGFARTSIWSLDKIKQQESGETIVSLSLSDKEVFDRQLVDFEFRLAVDFVIGSELEIELTATNLSTAPHSISSAIHTYFSVGDVEKIALSGLDGAKYLDCVVGADPGPFRQQGDITVSAEVDRIYDASGKTVITDPLLKRRIVIEKSGSGTTVVWNPWINKSIAMPDFGDDEYHTMICVECANARHDARTLAPGETHSMTQKISLERL